MKKHILTYLLAAGIFSGDVLQAQVSVPAEKNTLDFETRLYETQVLRKIALDKALEARGLPEKTVSSGGVVKQALYVTPTGHIVYNTTYNIGAGRTLSTNKVWPGGSSGVSLTGQNMPNRLGVWDGGRVLLTHQEFGSRVTQPDNASTLSDHATHVAGTMIASGIDANAKGMSYQATLKAYDWTNDETEMSQAAGAGMLISNHSYGSISGWFYNEDMDRWEWYGDENVSTVEDYKFGHYDDRAASWDELALNHPNYLICKSAGNDRGDNKTGSTWFFSDGSPGSGTPPPADGGAAGFDCIATNGTAKNILTVGAVNKIGGNSGNGWTQTSDVVMSSFSGWGPTDDGRVKPDVVGPGVSVYSALSTGNDDYGTLSGTSMATPAISGSLLLVQQHYNNCKGKYMRSASLKGLVIHTADEAGNAGPDYKFGWGLMNTASAIKFITDSNINKLEERVLNSGQQQSMQFSADAGKPLRITICWTDRPGTPVITSLLDNTTRMLVNDLDIRLTRNSDAATFSPYILDPATPNAAATTGDNIRDNVEMIYLAAPQSGIYTLTISNKGTLVGSTQPYTLLVSNAVEKPLALFSADKNVICANNSVTFSDVSSGAVTQRTWYFPGGNPSTSTALNPVITYAAPGKYPVALKVSGGLGTDSTYITDYITVGGLSLPFTETFEANSATLSSWTVDNPDAADTWALKTVAGSSPGNSAAGIPYYTYNAQGQRDGLISPVLSFRSFSSVSLTFNHAYTRYGGNSTSDSLIIYVSSNCGATWTRIQGFGENGTGNFATHASGFTFGSQSDFIPASASDWCGGGTGSSCKTIALNQFAGLSNIQIKFEGYNRYGNNMYLDNISVNGTLLKPVASFEAQTTVCQNEPVTFTDKTDHFPTAWNWTFTGANTATSTVKNPVVSYPALGQYTVKLRASNSSGADSITVTNYITVVPKPGVPNIKAAGPVSFCNGDSVLLSTDSTGTIRWYHDESLIAQNVQQVYAKNNGTYKVAKSNGACESFSTISVNALSKPAPPVITSSITGTAFCTGGSASLSSSATAGNQWFRNGSLIPGAINKTYTANDSGSYTVITDNGCASDMSLPKTYSLLPRPAISSITGADEAVQNSDVPYSVTAVSGNTYTWSVTNGLVLNGNNTPSVNIRFTGTDSGSISVTARSGAGCFSLASTKKVIITPLTGLSEHALVRNFTIYPVPAKTHINMAFEGIDHQTARVKLVNLLGQVIYEHDLQITTGHQVHKIELDQFTKGIYMIELQGKDVRISRRLVIE